MNIIDKFFSAITPPSNPAWKGFSDTGGFFSAEGGIAKSSNEQAAARYNELANKPKPHIVREQELERLTTPAMNGFFPDESAGKKGKTLTFFDTEVDDRGRVLTIAAKKVVYNFSKMRFENVKGDTGFFRVYDPVNVDQNIARTKGSHGLSHKLLSGFRKDNKVKYSSNWDLSQYEAFQQYIGDSEVAGHNIVKADIPWVMRPTGRDFNIDTYRKGFFDTLHYAKAITGKESAALQKLASRFNLTPQSMGLHAHDAASDVVTNIKVFEQLLKTNVNSPFTAEALYALGLKGVQTHYKSNLNLEEGAGSIIAGARGKPLHNLPYQGAKQALHNWSSTRGFKLEEPQVLDLQDAFDIPQDVYDNARSVSGYIGDTYAEEQQTPIDEAIMADYGSIKTLVERFRVLDTMKPEALSGSFDKDMQRIVRAFRTITKDRRGSGLSEANLQWSESEDAFLDKQLRDTGYTNPSMELKQRVVRRALQENAWDYWKRQVQLNETAANLVAKDRKRYGDVLEGQDWFDRFAALPEEDVSQAEIDIYKESKRDFFKKQAAEKKLRAAERKQAHKDRLANYKALHEVQADEESWYAPQRLIRRMHEHGLLTDEEKKAKAKADAEAQAIREEGWANINQIRTQAWDEAEAERISSFSRGLERRLANQQRGDEAYAKGLIFKSDLKQLDAATMSTEEYGKALDRLTERNKKVLGVTEKLSKLVPFYNPMNLIGAMDSQREGIRSAAHGILPGFLERPLFKGESAMHNIFNQFKADIGYKWDMSKMGAGIVGSAAGTAIGSFFGPLGGMIGANLGQAVGSMGSQALGGFAQKRVTELGEGVQHRLNLLGMTSQLLGAFANGLRMAIGLFGKLGQIWSYMPSYTLHTLTGVDWSRAQPMQAADRLMGFQAGTISNMYNQLAYQQADLYTSGMYDETKLVAAARLGIFDLAYGAMGGDIEQQQADIYDRLYRQLYESGLSKADVQSQLSLVKNYSPEMVAMLERGSKMGFRTYAELTSGEGRRFLSTSENASVSQTSRLWDLDQRSFKEGLSKAGVKAYELAEPIIEAVNTALWKFADTGQFDIDGIAAALEKVFGKINFDNITLNVDWDKWLKKLDPLLKGLIDKVSEGLRSLYDSLSATKIHADVVGLGKALLSGKPFELGDYISLATPKSAADQLKNVYENKQAELEKGEIPFSWDAPSKLALDYMTTTSPVYNESPVAFLGDKQWKSVASKYMKANSNDPKAFKNLAAMKSVFDTATDYLKDNDIEPTAAAYAGVFQFADDKTKQAIEPLINEFLQTYTDKRTGNIKTSLDTGSQTVVNILLEIKKALDEAGGKKVSLRVDDITQHGVNVKLEDTLRQVG